MGAEFPEQIALLLAGVWEPNRIWWKSITTSLVASRAGLLISTGHKDAPSAHGVTVNRYHAPSAPTDLPEVFPPASKNKSLASVHKTSAMAIIIPSAISSREPARLLTKSAAERFPAREQDHVWRRLCPAGCAARKRRFGRGARRRRSTGKTCALCCAYRQY
jgi:hypothetical protein